MLLAVGGMHGNEPDGVVALQAVAQRLTTTPVKIKGDLLMLAGNLPALERNLRYVERDLNRCWTAGSIERLRRDGPAGIEDKQQLGLVRALDIALRAARGQVFVLDLHCTSAEGVPFVMAPDTPEDRALAEMVPLPLVLGLLETITGTLTSYLKERACRVLALEGGRNGTSASIMNLDAALWLFITGIGLVAPNRVPGIAEYRARLSRAKGDLPAVIHVHHRRSVGAEDCFRMEPNFTNLQRIERGQLLAKDKRGEIRAEEDGFLVLPVYQSLGNDAFFLGTEHE